MSSLFGKNLFWILGLCVVGWACYTDTMTTEYDIVNQSGEVLDHATNMGQARYLREFHLFGQRTVSIVPVDVDKPTEQPVD